MVSLQQVVRTLDLPKSFQVCNTSGIPVRKTLRSQPFVVEDRELPGFRLKFRGLFTSLAKFVDLLFEVRYKYLKRMVESRKVVYYRANDLFYKRGVGSRTYGRLRCRASTHVAVMEACIHGQVCGSSSHHWEPRGVYRPSCSSVICKQMTCRNCNLCRLDPWGVSKTDRPGRPPWKRWLARGGRQGVAGTQPGYHGIVIEGQLHTIVGQTQHVSIHGFGESYSPVEDYSSGYPDY